jgi:hypothetical protein
LLKQQTGRRPTEALKRLLRIYDAWDKPNEGVKWRIELAAHKKAAETM